MIELWVSEPPGELDADAAESSEDAVGNGMDDSSGGTAWLSGAEVIVPGIADTKLLGTLVLLERDRRLYEWKIGGRGRSARGRRRGGAVAAARDARRQLGQNSRLPGEAGNN